MSRLVRRLLLSVVLAGLAPSVALAEWRRAESAHFIVYSDGTERNLRDYTTRLERFHSLLTVRYGGGTSDEIRKLPVYLVGNDRDLRVAQPRLPDGIAGYYTASENDVFAILIRGRDDDLLLHEYSHHFMAQAQGGQGRYPGWLNEGFAEYYATATVSERGKATFGMPGAWRMQNLQQNRWLPMDQVLRAKGSFDIQERNARNMYYAQSWALTHWLLADQNRARALGAYDLRHDAGGPDRATAGLRSRPAVFLRTGHPGDLAGDDRHPASGVVGRGHPAADQCPQSQSG